MAHTGNYVAGAWGAEGELVGASVGFLAADGTLHSHVTGVAHDAQGRGIGVALKQHQRAWAADRGLAAVTWTFDPLLRRNARFNLIKLGAVGVAYEPNFYGSMADGVNAGDESDRLFVRWDVGTATAGEEPDVDELRSGGATVALAPDDQGRPVLGEVLERGCLCWVPADVASLRSSDPALALAWRRALRQTLGAAVCAGTEVTAMTRSGWYVLRRPE